MGFILLVLLVLLLIGYFPSGGATYAPLYGPTYSPIGFFGIAIILIILFVIFGGGRMHF